MIGNWISTRQARKNSLLPFFKHNKNLFFYAKNNRHLCILLANSFDRLLKCGDMYCLNVIWEKKKKWCAKSYLGEKNRHCADERVKESNEPISLTFGATRHLLIIISRHYNNHERSGWRIWKKRARERESTGILEKERLAEVHWFSNCLMSSCKK